MAYSTPSTFVAGNVLTAAQLNTYLRDNIAWMATDSPTVRAYHSTTQSIANATIKSVVFNSERYDNAAMHSTSSNTARFTVPTGGAGKYLMGVNLFFASAITADMWFELNGTDVSVTNLAHIQFPTGKMILETLYALSDADYFTTTVLQSSGGAVNISNISPYSPEMWAFWVRT